MSETRKRSMPRIKTRDGVHFNVIPGHNIALCGKAFAGERTETREPVGCLACLRIVAMVQGARRERIEDDHDHADT